VQAAGGKGNARDVVGALPSEPGGALGWTDRRVPQQRDEKEAPLSIEMGLAESVPLHRERSSSL
jgi:hypothetical protein